MMLRPSPSVDEGAVDGDVVDGWRAQEGDYAHAPCGNQMILLIEADLAHRPLHQTIADAGLRRRDFSRQLLEVTI
jgi:hypothetical protein